MYKNILIATDGSELAQKAVTHGLALAKAVNASVTIVVATEIWSAMHMAAKAESDRHAVERYEKAQADWAATVLSDAAQAARQSSVPYETVHVNDIHPADGIIKTAQDKGCDLIVMASHGRRGIGRLLLGSVALTVLTHSTIPIMIYR